MASFLGKNAAQCEAKEPPANASGENIFILLNTQHKNIFIFLNINIQQNHFKVSTRTSTLRSPVGFGSAPVGSFEKA